MLSIRDFSIKLVIRYGTPFRLGTSGKVGKMAGSVIVLVVFGSTMDKMFLFIRVCLVKGVPKNANRQVPCRRQSSVFSVILDVLMIGLQ